MKIEEFVISEGDSVGASQDGSRCVLEVIDLDGGRLNLIFSPEDGPNLSHRIAAAVSQARTASGRILART
jgi:hypothetical protein